MLFDIQNRELSKSFLYTAQHCYKDTILDKEEDETILSIHPLQKPNLPRLNTTLEGDSLSFVLEKVNLETRMDLESVHIETSSRWVKIYRGCS